MQQLQSAIYHLDQTLAVMGHAPRKAIERRFANGELISLGEAERAGCNMPSRIVSSIVAARGWDASDLKLRNRLMLSVKDCRKRLNAKDA